MIPMFVMGEAGGKPLFKLPLEGRVQQSKEPSRVLRGHGNGRMKLRSEAVPGSPAEPHGRLHVSERV